MAPWNRFQNERKMRPRRPVWVDPQRGRENPWEHGRNRVGSNLHQNCKFLLDFSAPSFINVDFEEGIEAFCAQVLQHWWGGRQNRPNQNSKMNVFRRRRGSARQNRSKWGREWKILLRPCCTDPYTDQAIVGPEVEFFVHFETGFGEPNVSETGMKRINIDGGAR